MKCQALHIQCLAKAHTGSLLALSRVSASTRSVALLPQTISNSTVPGMAWEVPPQLHQLLVVSEDWRAPGNHKHWKGFWIDSFLS